MSTTTTTTTATMKKQVITTDLIGKQETFKILAVAKAMHTATLLIGPPGVSKTKCVTDFAKAQFEGGFGEVLDKTFILETDEGTKSSEIKGTLDVESLVLKNQYAMNTPITKAEYVVINEVDKASSGVRNALLGIMNERVLFSGKDKIPCDWKVFVATANEIPKEEVGSPFWDRFMIKFKVDRVSAGEMTKYFKNGDKKFSTTVTLPDPTEEDIQAVVVPVEKLEIFMSVLRPRITDRTLSFVPRMARVVSIIYGKGIDASLVKVAELLTGDAGLAKELDKKLAPAEKRAVLDKVDLLAGIQDEGQLRKATDEIERMVGQYEASGKLSASDIEEIEKSVTSVMENHPLVNYSGVEI